MTDKSRSDATADAQKAMVEFDTKRSGVLEFNDFITMMTNNGRNSLSLKLTEAQKKKVYDLAMLMEFKLAKSTDNPLGRRKVHPQPKPNFVTLNPITRNQLKLEDPVRGHPDVSLVDIALVELALVELTLVDPR